MSGWMYVCRNVLVNGHPRAFESQTCSSCFLSLLYLPRILFFYFILFFFCFFIRFLSDSKRVFSRECARESTTLERFRLSIALGILKHPVDSRVLIYVKQKKIFYTKRAGFIHFFFFLYLSVLSCLNSSRKHYLFFFISFHSPHWQTRQLSRSEFVWKFFNQWSLNSH